MIKLVQPLLVTLLLIVGTTPAMIYIPGVPVDSMTLYQLQVACNMFQDRLKADPSLSDSFQLYGDAYLTNYFLQKVANDPGIAQYNNVLYGEQNSVNHGNKNIIFGNGNKVAGSSNYIFSSDFDSSQVSSGSITNNLVLDDWLI